MVAMLMAFRINFFFFLWPEAEFSVLPSREILQECQKTANICRNLIKLVPLLSDLRKKKKKKIF